MAALLCRGEGEGINSAAGFRGSWGGDGSGYLGNALGGNKNKLEFVKLEFVKPEFVKLEFIKLPSLIYNL